ncbi:MAG: hypothetical protein K2P48_01190 [Lachnospiraceae bacterium]|nr:hypothetical protein [Lachnospiraceae bacterium]
MVTLNPNMIIEDSFVMTFGLRSYIDILSVIQQDNYVAMPEFRKVFNVSRIVFCLEKTSGTIDVSFVNKMLAAVINCSQYGESVYCSV